MQHLTTFSADKCRVMGSWTHADLQQESCQFNQTMTTIMCYNQHDCCCAKWWISCFSQQLKILMLHNMIHSKQISACTECIFNAPCFVFVKSWWNWLTQNDKNHRIVTGDILDHHYLRGIVLSSFWFIKASSFCWHGALSSNRDDCRS